MFENSEIKYVKGKNVDYIQFKRLLKYGVKNAYTLRGENVDFSHYGESSNESYKILCEELNLQDMSDEVLYGFVTNKDEANKTITVKPIGGNFEEHTWKEKYFKKAEVPEYFKDKTNLR